MFKVRKQKMKKFEGVYSVGSFKWAIKHTCQMIEWSKTIEDKLSTIDYVMNVVKKDVETDALTRYLYHPPYYYKNENYFLLPTCCYTKSGEKIDLMDDG